MLLVSEPGRLGRERLDGVIQFDSLGYNRLGKDLVSHGSESNRVSIFTIGLVRI